MKKYLKLIGFGFLTWLVPFVVAFGFYNKEGQLCVDLQLFKSIMILVGAAVGVWLMVLYFKKIDKSYIFESLVLGFSWLLINVLLDLAVLVRMMHMDLGAWTVGVGLRYLIIPIIAIGMGSIAEKR